MELKEYTVEKSGRIQGLWREKNETIKLSDAAARYPVMSGQIKLKGTKKTTTQKSEDK